MCTDHAALNINHLFSETQQKIRYQNLLTTNITTKSEFFRSGYTFLNLSNFEVLSVLFTFEMSKKTVDKGKRLNMEV